jgi:hypothetical protein
MSMHTQVPHSKHMHRPMSTATISDVSLGHVKHGRLGLCTWPVPVKFCPTNVPLLIAPSTAAAADVADLALGTASAELACRSALEDTPQTLTFEDAGGSASAPCTRCY